MALERAFAVTGDTGRVIVIAGNAHIPHITAQTSSFSTAQKKRLIIIGEPAAKNTAPAIACAAIYSLLVNKNKNNRKMLVLTSDHIIKPLASFKKDAALAAAAAGEGKLAVFGIPPTRPETGYGYIEAVSREQRTKNGEQSAGKKENKVLNVVRFHEKPDMATAEKYSTSGKFFWNSGMFAFSIDFISRQFREFAEDVFTPFEKLKEPKKEDYTVSRGVKILKGWKGLKAAYNKAKSISFDFAIAEKCRDAVMVQTSFDWIDIGNWEEYIKICDKNDSVVFNASSRNCYIDSDIPVAIAGADDLIVVIRNGKNGEPAVALITRKGHTQNVREITEQIKKSGRSELL